MAVLDDKARTAEGMKSLEAMAVLNPVLIWRRIRRVVLIVCIVPARIDGERL